MKHLNIATPAYDGTVSVGYCQSLVQTVIACTVAKIAISTEYLPGSCYIDRARNWLVHRFLQSSADALLFIDADVRWDAAAVVKLYESPFAVVGGVYPMKQPGEQWPVQMLHGQQDGFLEALYLPTGLMLIRRAVFERMAPHVPQYEAHGELVRGYFQCVMDPKGYVGEDVEFCNRWRRLGGSVWCWPDIDFEHFGGKSWGGNFARYLERAA